MRKQSVVLTLGSLAGAEHLRVGTERVASILGFSLGEGGVLVCAEKGSRNGVSYANGHATVYYSRDNMFFRELGLLVQHLTASEEAFEVMEDDHFTCLSTMVDVSRNGVPTVESLKRFIDYMAVMGYDTILVYMEDMVKLESRPYFGYMRGRYTTEQLRALDDYAYAYGIEVVPCIECYGHMEKYLIWPEAAPIKDTAAVLLAREEKTFAFLDELIGTLASCFRSRRIHIGMDEAWDMGRGKFLDKNGYVPPADIFNEFMERLIGITDRYGLVPMMWCDMYCRIKSQKGSYYDPDIVFDEEDARKIPDGVELVFWHYGEAPNCDGYMLEKLGALNKHLIFAGGTWNWIGHFPEHHYTMETSRFSLEACRQQNVCEAMLTIWFNDNAECDLFANLLDMSFFAELCFDPHISEEGMKARFEATTGGLYEAFWAMSRYHNSFGPEDVYPSFHSRFLGKPLFWQDVLEGLYDSYLLEKPMSAHYAAAKTEMATYCGGPWEHLYRFAEQVFDYLAVKCLIAETLQAAYKEGNREVLAEIKDTLLPLLRERTLALKDAHRALWFRERTMIGWCNLDVRYAGVAARCDTACYLLERYLSGEDARIDSLEEVRLPKAVRGFNSYSRIATPNLFT